MPGTTAKTNSSTDNRQQHGQYYITGADLIVRVRGFPIEYRVVALSEAEANRWKTRSFAYIAIFSDAIQRIFAPNFLTHRHLGILSRARRTATL